MTHPWYVACIKAVHPCTPSCLSTSALFSTMSCTTSSWPLTAAIMRGDAPSWLDEFTCVGSSSRISLTSCEFPVRTDKSHESGWRESDPTEGKPLFTLSSAVTDPTSGRWRHLAFFFHRLWNKRVAKKWQENVLRNTSEHFDLSLALKAFISTHFWTSLSLCLATNH